MAIAQTDRRPEALPQPMTYEEYMAEGEVMLRYDIVDGVRYVTNPTRLHQRIQGNIYVAFRSYAIAQRIGMALQSPCDVLIQRAPLRVRQPDILLIGNLRLAANPPETDPSPLNPAPELIVEIVSPSDRPFVLADKIADYQRVNVQEGWIARPIEQTVEVVALSPSQVASIAMYGAGETVQSVVFPDLAVAVDAIFAP